MTIRRDPSEEDIAAFVIAAHGDLDIVRNLYHRSPALLNARYARFNETALEAAGHMGRRDIAAYLLAEGAPLTIFAAAMLGDIERVEQSLREDPSRASQPGVHGISLLYHAALSGNTEVAALVLRHSGAVQIDAALHAAVKTGHHVMVGWLLAHGVRDVNVPDIDGKTPLRVAIDAGWEDSATLLRRHGGRA